MNTIVRRPYWNHENEEAWLNEMAAKGLALTSYSWCKYVFAPCQPGEYIYRIELLDKLATHPESQAYLQFMQENGVEHVASYMRWVYFRKKAAEGPFDIYTDLDSRIGHYQRIKTLWTALAGMELVVGIPNVLMGTGLLFGSATNLYNTNLILGTVCTALGLVFLSIALPLHQRIKQLKADKLILE